MNPSNPRIHWLPISLSNAPQIRAQATEIANLYQFIYNETLKSWRGDTQGHADVKIPNFENVDQMALLHALKSAVKHRITEFQHFFISNGATMDDRGMDLEEVRLMLRKVLTMCDLNALEGLRREREEREEMELQKSVEQLRDLPRMAPLKLPAHEEVSPPVSRDPTPRKQSPSPHQRSPRRRGNVSRNESISEYNEHDETLNTSSGPRDVSSYGYMNDSTEDIIHGILRSSEAPAQRVDAPPTLKSHKTTKRKVLVETKVTNRPASVKRQPNERVEPQRWRDNAPIPAALRPDARRFTTMDDFEDNYHPQRAPTPEPMDNRHRQQQSAERKPHRSPLLRPTNSQPRQSSPSIAHPRQHSSVHHIPSSSVKLPAKKSVATTPFVRSKDLRKSRVKPLYAWEKRSHHQKQNTSTQSAPTMLNQQDFPTENTFVFKLDESDFEHLMSKRRASFGILEPRKDFLRKGYGRLASEPGAPKRLIVDRRDGSRHIVDVSKVPVRNLDGLYATSAGPYLDPTDFKHAHSPQKERWVTGSEFKTALKPMEVFPPNTSLPLYLNAGLPWSSANVDLVSQKIREMKLDPEKRVGERDFFTSVRSLDVSQVDKQYGLGMIQVRGRDE